MAVASDTCAQGYEFVLALSLPEMILLRRVLRPKLLAAFVGVVAAAILATSYLFNLIL